MEQLGNTGEGLGCGEVSALQGVLLRDEFVAGNGELGPGVENFGSLDGGKKGLSLVLLQKRWRGVSTSGPGRPWSWALTLHGKFGFPYW